MGGPMVKRTSFPFPFCLRRMDAARERACESNSLRTEGNFARMSVPVSGLKQSSLIFETSGTCFTNTIKLFIIILGMADRRRRSFFLLNNHFTQMACQQNQLFYKILIFKKLRHQKHPDDIREKKSMLHMTEKYSIFNKITVE
jgi:hypothetical protein